MPIYRKKSVKNIAQIHNLVNIQNYIQKLKPNLCFYFTNFFFRYSLYLLYNNKTLASRLRPRRYTILDVLFTLLHNYLRHLKLA